MGVVTRLHDNAPQSHDKDKKIQIKSVIAALDSEPVLDAGLLKLGEWIAQQPRELADEMARALESGPMLVPNLAREVHRQRDVVADVLLTDGRFVRVPAPPERSGKGKWWALASHATVRVGTSALSDDLEVAA